MTASEFQSLAKELLQRHYEEVILEWPVHRDAMDGMQHDPRQYYPRTDIAVGPFSRSQGHNSQIVPERINTRLLRELADLPEANPNPRCLLAIEVVFSGSAKHILGDILNAGAIGLYGIIVTTPVMMPKVERNIEYLRKLIELEKISSFPFQNVKVFETQQFRDLIS